MEHKKLSNMAVDPCLLKAGPLTKPSQNGWISCICELKHIPIVKQQLRNTEWSFVFIFWCHSQCNTPHNAGPFLSFNKQILKKPNDINKKFLKYESTNHNSFRLSSLLKKIISMCIQHFQKTGETDGFLLNTLGINDGRLLYTSTYLFCSLLFIPCAPGMSTSYHLWSLSVTWVPLLT